MPTTRQRKNANVVALPVQTTIVVARIDKASWLVRQNGEPLRSPSGGVRKFGTESVADTAGEELPLIDDGGVK